MVQVILRVRSKASNFCLLCTLYNTVLSHTQFINFPKEIWNKKNKQIVAIFWIMWTGSQLHYAWRGIHCRSPVVTSVSYVAQGALKPIHWLSAHSTCRKLYVWFNSTQPSVLWRLLFVVCCSSSAVQSFTMVPTAL
jgi:hypothetical protein